MLDCLSRATPGSHSGALTTVSLLADVSTGADQPRPPRRPAFRPTPPPHEKSGPSHLERLLRLASAITVACRGGIGVLSNEGKLIEHVTTGMPDGAAAELWRSPWLGGLIHSLASENGPSCLN